MPRYKKGIRNNCFHQNYTHDVLFPGATFRTRHNGECAILGRSDDKSRRGYYVVEFKDSGIIKEAYGSHIKTGSVSDEAFPSSEEERRKLLMTPKYYGVDILVMDVIQLLKTPEHTKEREHSCSGITCWQGAT